VHLIADTTIVTLTVQRLRVDGHNVVYVGERDEDPGDRATARSSAKRMLRAAFC